MAVHTWRMGFTSMNGRSPRDAKLFALFTQTRMARVRRVGMKGLRSTRWTVIVAQFRSIVCDSQGAEVIYESTK